DPSAEGPFTQAPVVRRPAAPTEPDDPHATRHVEPTRSTGPGDTESIEFDPYATADVDPTDGVGSGPSGDHEGRPSIRPVATSVPGYEIRGVLGRGGMGVVYRALQLRANRMVALKMILGDVHVGHSHLERFRIEAESVAGLRHRNIIQVYDVGEV